MIIIDSRFVGVGLWSLHQYSPKMSKVAVLLSTTPDPNVNWQTYPPPPSVTCDRTSRDSCLLSTTLVSVSLLGEELMTLVPEELKGLSILYFWGVKLSHSSFNELTVWIEPASSNIGRR